MASASFRSVAEMFLHRVSSTPDSEAFTFPTDQGWRTITWEETGARVAALAAGLLGLGLQAEQRGAILCSTRVEWILADLAILRAGMATTTIHPQCTDAECEHILGDSESRVVFTENAEQTARIEAMRGRLPWLRRVIQIQPGGEASHDLDLGSPRPFVVTMAALDEAGRAWESAHPGELSARSAAVQPEHLATLMYTSGTTGVPKGVELTHDAWVYEGEAMDALGLMTPADRQLLFLPLAHSFAKALQVASIRIGISTVVDGRHEELVRTMSLTRPTFVAAVPRVFEKLLAGMEARVDQRGAPGRWAWRRSLALGGELSRARQEGRRPGRGTMLRHALLDRLIVSRFRQALGGRLRFFISGAAPLSRELAELFHAAGVLVLEGYGLTESSAASVVNRPERFRFGTVGLPLPGVELRIDPADGEILLRSRGLMRGYHGLPEDTAAALTPDGWLRTGDIGTIDGDGFLTITDRKKELIKTSGGKFVAPRPIEDGLRAASPWIAEALVHGESRAFVVALLALDPGQVKRWAQEHHRPAADAAEVGAEPEVIAELQAAVDRVNSKRAAHEQVRAFAILPRGLTVEEGELTPTMKMKRRAVEERYRELLDGFYLSVADAP